MKYYAKPVDKIDNGKGFWHYLIIGVFQVDDDGKETEVGRYQRNYGSFYDTFYAFERDGRWYALYSRDYTSTRVMSLPDCADLGGEERAAGGFCPVDYYVPAYRVGHGTYHDGRPMRYAVSDCETDLSKEYGVQGDTYDPVRYAKFGFVAGCVWGDDTSWKIQIIDLSDPANPVRKPDLLGYIEMFGTRIKDCIWMDFHVDDDGDGQYAQLVIAERRRAGIDLKDFGVEAVRVAARE